MVYGKIMHDKARTGVRSVYGETENFTAKVSVHRGSASSPAFLFKMKIDELIKGVQNQASMQMMWFQ